MSSYFEEHDCAPLEDGQQPNHLLHLARLLLDTGLAMEWNMEYENIFSGEKPAPATSKKVVESLPRRQMSHVDVARGCKCPVCLAPFDEGDRAVELPCKHTFHHGCILPWLNKTNTCPMCRHELPTDDPDYEEFRKQKARAKQREFELDNLHSAMYG